MVRHSLFFCQLYDLWFYFTSVTGVWSLPDSKGAIVKGGYGHSSVYNADTKRIYVHGGYLSGSQTMYYLSDELHSFDPVNREW